MASLNLWSLRSRRISSQLSQFSRSVLNVLSITFAMGFASFSTTFPIFTFEVEDSLSDIFVDSVVVQASREDGQVAQGPDGVVKRTLPLWLWELFPDWLTVYVLCYSAKRRIPHVISFH